MKIVESFNKDKPTISFEFFPPKTPEQEENLFRVVSELKQFNPNFISVTYGALGTTRGKTFFWAKKIKEEFGIEPVAHLTCIAATKEIILSQLDELADLGVSNILALRGDPPEGQSDFKPPTDGFKYAKELVSFIKKNRPGFCVGVAGFPQGHCGVTDLELDAKYLKEKIVEGGEYVITQLFFNNQDFFGFKAKCERNKISVPIIPGLMTVTNFKQIQKITQICGATIPKELLSTLEKHADDQKSIEQIGIEHTVEQCNGLLASGAQGLHFFVLNKSESMSAIFRQLKFPGS